MTEQKIVNHIRRFEPELLGFLEEMVLVQSGSRNKKGVDAVGRLIRSRLRDHDFLLDINRQKEFGDHLVFRTRAAEKTDRRILLTGHMDTVFPADTEFRDFRRDGNRCYGPGVIDMKGGLAVAIYALKTLDTLGMLADLPVTLICNSDEEIGSPSSRGLIREEARKSVFAFVLEAGGINGEVVTGRKGNMVLELHIQGQDGHAAFVGHNKTSAILELAHQTIAFEALNDVEAGISVNVGQVTGGIGHNSVPATAWALIDFRFESSTQRSSLHDAIALGTGAPHIAGTRVAYKIRSERPAMPDCAANANLYAILAETAVKLRLPIQAEYRFGVSDANIIADEGIPVLDGLGPIGADDHSNAEYMITPSLAERTSLLACALVRCWQRHLQGGFPV